MPIDRESEGSRTAKQNVLRRPHGRSEFSLENGKFPDTAKVRWRFLGTYHYLCIRRAWSTWAINTGSRDWTKEMRSAEERTAGPKTETFERTSKEESLICRYCIVRQIGKPLFKHTYNGYPRTLPCLIIILLHIDETFSPIKPINDIWTTYNSINIDL